MNLTFAVMSSFIDVSDYTVLLGTCLQPWYLSYIQDHGNITPMSCSMELYVSVYK